MRAMMRAPAALLGLTLLVAPSCSHEDAPSAPRIAGPLAPALDLPRFESADAAPVRLDAYAGRPVLVTFWATWCPPCVREMPALAEVHERYHGRGLEILAVSIDQDPGALRHWLRERPVPFPVLRDAEGAAASRYGVTTVPAAFLVDGRGRVVERIDGAVDWTGDEVLALVDDLVAEGRS